MRIIPVAIAVGLIAGSAAHTSNAAHSVPATQRADLSGTWQATELDPPGMGEAVGAVMGYRFALRIDGNRITLTHILRDELITMELESGGPPVRTRQPGLPCEGDSFPNWAAAWEGGTLILNHIGSEPPGGGGSMGPSAGARQLRIIRPDVLLADRPARLPGELGPVVGSVYRRVSVPVGAELTPPRVAKASATIASVTWIAGSWRTPTGPITTEQYWTVPQFGSMMGLSRGLGKTTQVRYEFLCIVERDGSLLYQHAPNGQPVPTRYTLTAISGDVATFENPNAGYPKLIRYTRYPDGSLQIRTEDAGGKDVRFTLLRRTDTP